MSAATGGTIGIETPRFTPRLRGRPFDPRVRFVVGFRQPRRLLDLGCGAGENGIDFRRYHPEVHVCGVDLERRPVLPDYVEFRRLDLDGDVRLDWDDDSFDAVTITHVIEHLRNPLPLAREIGRVLAPGGALYVEAPNWPSLIIPSLGVARELHDCFNFWDDPTHVRPWSSQALYEWTTAGAGLSCVACGPRVNAIRRPLDPFVLVWSLIRRDRHKASRHMANLVGWAAFAIGVKS